MKRGNVCRCVFKKPPLGDLAVPERVEVCPLLLDRVARRLADTTLKPHDDDGVALGDELARLELLKFEVFIEQGEVLRDSLVSVASAGKRDTEGPCWIHSTSSVRRSRTAGISPRPNALYPCCSTSVFVRSLILGTYSYPLLSIAPQVSKAQRRQHIPQMSDLWCCLGV